ncbi:MAG: hypothetical protein F4Y02_12400 [Chloroflexi bacterium]|nr:hypothetical protein [Chloroflexota bacterium]
MKTTEHGIQDSRDVENMYHMRLMTLLQELVRERGYKGAARVLEIDQRTVAESAKTGRLSRRAREALERALQEGVGSAAARQRERNDKLEERVEALESAMGALRSEMESMGKEARRRLSKVEGAVDALGRDGDVSTKTTGAGHAGAGPSRQSADEGGGGTPEREGSPAPKSPTWREYPELVTLEAADDDEEVFGEAWPLIVEWREMKESHPDEGKGLEWLAGRERLLEVELALMEDHEMTLPPEKQPLHGLDRSGQVSWRRKALFGTRRARARSEIVTWVWRVLTLRWLWTLR